jgi:hypothetical protein
VSLGICLLSSRSSAERCGPFTFLKISTDKTLDWSASSISPDEVLAFSGERVSIVLTFKFPDSIDIKPHGGGQRRPGDEEGEGIKLNPPKWIKNKILTQTQEITSQREVLEKISKLCRKTGIFGAMRQ